ncbi:hypothetical protein OBBRIDRAFT_807354 [Obba rivulosa]|uniref:Uncharacterized protein n=1 Tax=Obba rivulosa TaxID=1052685 RepID=A0A8E2AJH3_9APHY|nr:hypothetical protein OBBRIDRAFT_807354 [Obba rivulosa]
MAKERARGLPAGFAAALCAPPQAPDMARLLRAIHSKPPVLDTTSREDISGLHALRDAVQRDLSVPDAALIIYALSPFSATRQLSALQYPQTTTCHSLLHTCPTRGDGARIPQTVGALREMGIDVQLGERAPVVVPVSSSSSPDEIQEDVEPVPTQKINLDLSLLLALVLDITRAPLPVQRE